MIEIILPEGISKSDILFSHEHDLTGIYHNGLIEIQTIIETTIDAELKIEKISQSAAQTRELIKQSNSFYNLALDLLPK